MSMQKILVLGATSTIAQELERLLAKDGYHCLLVARSPERLAALQADLLARGAADVQTFTADLRDTARHPQLLEWAKKVCPDFDTVVLAYGSMRNQEDCERRTDWVLDELFTNFVSAASLLNVFAKHFEERRRGCIAAITSVAGDRGRRSNYVYGSAKGGLSLFLQGLRSRLHASGVRVITIKPGPVKTAMTDHMRQSPIFADVSVVAQDIHDALQKGSTEILYTPRRWRFIMAGIRAIPERVFKRFAV
jgi:decaprenylphospho-beta-D-erythro-pentofuranosid-2-ulose 2-reductase